jgi:hypothetical protein
MDSVELDIAVLGKDTCTSLEFIDKTHTVELDEIPIDFSLFKQIFYPYGDNFCLEKLCQNKVMYPYITFSAVYRSYKGKPFSLLDTIIENIETDFLPRFKEFYGSEEMRTCDNCAHVMEVDPKFVYSHQRIPNSTRDSRSQVEPVATIS